MDQRLSLITLGVADVERSRSFYEALGWRTNARLDDDVVFFQAGGMIVALWDRAKLAEDSGVQDPGGSSGFTLAHNVRSPEEADAIAEEVRAAGGTITREPGRDLLGRLLVRLHRSRRPPLGGRATTRTGPSPTTAARSWEPIERRPRSAALARPRPRPPRGPAASARSDAAPLQGRQPQALALPRRVLRRGDGLRGARQRRSGLADVLGGLGPRRARAHRAHRHAPARRSRRGLVRGRRGRVRSTTRPTRARLVRIEATHPEAGPVRGFLRTGGGTWAECVCANGEDGFVWTRKRVVRVEVDVRFGERRIRCNARGVEDESAGYHPTHTVWSWSAGVGILTDGREVGWNLVEGVNDPPERSERAIWVDGEPFEPGPVDVRRASRRSRSTTDHGSSATLRPSARESRSAARSPTPTASPSAPSRGPCRAVSSWRAAWA